MGKLSRMLSGERLISSTNRRLGRKKLLTWGNLRVNRVTRAHHTIYTRKPPYRENPAALPERTTRFTRKNQHTRIFHACCTREERISLTAREKKDACITRVSVFIDVGEISIIQDGITCITLICLRGGGTEALVLQSIHLPRLPWRKH